MWRVWYFQQPMGRTRFEDRTITTRDDFVYAEIVSNAMSALTLASGDTFGAGVARDGNLLAVGAPGDDTDGSNRGAVYLINDSDGDGQWADAISSDVIKVDSTTTGITLANSDRFGFSVALDDGVLAVGSPNDDTGGADRGAVYLIDDGGNGWADIVASDVTKISNSTTGITLANGDYFGSSVALNGGVLAVGANYDDTGGSDRGAVYLIDDGGNGWADIVASDVTKISNSTTGITLANGDEFGSAVALDGGVLAIGAYGDRGAGLFAGAVYILDDKNNDGSYAGTGENVKLDNNTAGISLVSQDLFGRGVALDTASGLLAVGADGTDGGFGSGKGMVYLIESGGDGWQSVVAADVTEFGNGNHGLTLESHRFGTGVSLEGGVLVVGQHAFAPLNTGAVYVFESSYTATISTDEFEKDATPTDDDDLGAGTVTVSATPTDVAGNVGEAATTTFTYDPSVPTLTSGSYLGTDVLLTMSEAVIWRGICK